MPVLWTLSELVAEAATRLAALPAPKNGQVRAIPDERTIRYYGTLGLLDPPAVMRGRTALYGPRHAAQVVAIKRLQTTGRSLAEIQQLWPELDDATLARMSGVELPVAPVSPGRAGFWKRPPAGEDRGAARTAAPRGQGGDTGAAAAPGARSGDVVGGEGEIGGQGGDAAGAAAAMERGGPGRAGERRSAGGGAMRGAGEGVMRGAGEERSAGERSMRGAGEGGLAGTSRSAIELRVELAPGVVLSLSHFEESAAVSLADVRAIRAAAAPLLAELGSRRLAPHADSEGGT